MARPAPALALLLALLAGPAGAQDQPGTEKVALRYGPRAETDYWIREEAKRTETPPGGTPQEAFSDALSLVNRVVYALPDRTLMVNADELGREDVLNQVPLDETGLDTWVYRITPRGERPPQLEGAGLEESDDMEDGTLPVLPGPEVGLGHVWKQTMRPSDLPFDVPVIHRLLGEDQVQGTRCALIETMGKTKGKDAKTGNRYAAKIAQALALSLEDGSVVKLSNHIALKLKKPDGSLVTVTRFRVIQRREGDDVPPEGGEHDGEADDLGDL